MSPHRMRVAVKETGWSKLVTTALIDPADDARCMEVFESLCTQEARRRYGAAHKPDLSHWVMEIGGPNNVVRTVTVDSAGRPKLTGRGR